MRIIHRTAVAAVATLALLGGAAVGAAPALATTYPNPTCVKTLVPEYSNAMWTGTTTGTPVAYASVANWGSTTQNGGGGGPGLAKVTANATIINTAKTNGVKTVYGYIYTNNGAGGTGYTESDIETQMTQWHSWYGITNFFFDQVDGSSTVNQPFYSHVEAWARTNIASGSQFVLNFGTFPASSSWMTYANTASVVEVNGTDPGTPPSWMNSYSPTRFAGTAQSIPNDKASTDDAVQDLMGAHVSRIYVDTATNFQNFDQPSWTEQANDFATGTGC